MIGVRKEDGERCRNLRRVHLSQFDAQSPVVALDAPPPTWGRLPASPTGGQPDRSFYQVVSPDLRNSPDTGNSRRSNIPGGRKPSRIADRCLSGLGGWRGGPLPDCKSFQCFRTPQVSPPGNLPGPGGTGGNLAVWTLGGDPKLGGRAAQPLLTLPRATGQTTETFLITEETSKIPGE